MFDRFSIDVRGLEEGWRRVGGGLEEDRRREDWRRIGGVQNGWKSRKTVFYVFCNFTHLSGRFRLSRLSQTIDLEEIYRFVSKILNFTPCGSVFGRFCVFDGVNRIPSMDSMKLHGANGIPGSQWISRESMKFHGVNWFSWSPWIFVKSVFFTPKCRRNGFGGGFRRFSIDFR